MLLEARGGDARVNEEVEMNALLMSCGLLGALAACNGSGDGAASGSPVEVASAGSAPTAAIEAVRTPRTGASSPIPDPVASAVGSTARDPGLRSTTPAAGAALGGVTPAEATAFEAGKTDFPPVPI